MRTEYVEEAVQRWAAIDPTLDDDEVLSTGIRIGILARRRERALASALVVFGDRGVRNMEDYRLLALTTRTDPRPTTASEASVIVGLSKAATAVRLERFEAEGLVERAVRKFDRRTIEVTVTTVGRDLAIECTHVVKRVYAELLSALSEDEHGQLEEILQRIGVDP